MEGSVQTLEFDGLKIHVYTAPAESIFVNSTILEFADRLIAMDGQMFRQFAVEVGDVIESLGKRIDRFVISHDHPDHYAGFEYLTGRFPGVQLAALPAVRVSLIGEGAQVLAVRRGLFGDTVAARAAIPDATIVPGELTIAGVRFVFQEYDHTESQHSLGMILPDLGVALLADLVAGPTEHLFTVQPNFDEWEAALRRVRADVARYGIKTIVVGHGNPLGPEVLPSNLAYLEAAREAYATAGTVDDYKAAMRASMPNRGPQASLDFIGQQLYGLLGP